MNRAATTEPAARQLDDRADREELRSRYYGLLQELRVVLPGVQVLLAFLLTAPFTERFDQLDRTGRAVFMASLGAALASVICLIAPTVYHRVADRTERSARVEWGVRLALAGMWLLAAALLTALWNVARFVYGADAAAALTAAAAAMLLALWLVLPAASGRRHERT